jgi:ribose transport system ATP-binding protein
MKKMMVGREIKGDYYRSDYDGYSNEVVLKADCITTRHDLMCFDLELHKGEILGIGGLSECGMHTVGKALFGAEKILDGQVTVGPQKTVVKDPETAIRNSIGYTSKDRDRESVGLSGTIHENIASTGYIVNRLFGPIISFRKEKKYVGKEIMDLSLKCASPYHAVNTLSGGNKQKVVFGKWIGADSQILILDCPTRGIDIGVKAAMYQLIYQFKKEGRSILLISEELQELIGMSDRILIMKDGKIVHEAMRKDNPTENDLIEHMI